ncbi:hypothetical protein FOWG_13716 [Fusarium oxysporum f. sp. lycopersici MN25]|uniref:Uncharacterized protein n=1 Tax=Fusarium oxysporum Fo47 TaxID=660027 RepID=W9K1Y2_FUSOX|nr:hypothetical protein FOZG_10028 [Fusarium oxysporum Fo47]EWZ82967.1 hypothetical protein FOWG_13716 [Fusarium oxysporum f. sp. lycopersici MN25]
MSNKGWMGKVSICRSLYRARMPEVPLTVGPRPLPGPNPSPGFLSPPPQRSPPISQVQFQLRFPRSCPQVPLWAVKAGALANSIVELMQTQSGRRLESTHGSSIIQHWLSHGHGFKPATSSYWKPNSSRGEGKRSLSCFDTTPSGCPMLFLTKQISLHPITRANA